MTKTNVSVEVSTDLDLRGQNVEEGLMEVDAFLDRAARMNLPRVTIIHGKGTGVLPVSYTHLAGKRGDSYAAAGTSLQ